MVKDVLLFALKTALVKNAIFSVATASRAIAGFLTTNVGQDVLIIVRMLYANSERGIAHKDVVKAFMEKDVKIFVQKTVRAGYVHNLTVFAFPVILDFMERCAQKNAPIPA